MGLLDIRKEFDENKGYYGPDTPLDKVAREVHASSQFANTPYEDWLKTAVVPNQVEEDNYQREVQATKDKPIGLIREFGRGVGRGVMQGLPEAAGQSLQLADRAITAEGEAPTILSTVGKGIEAFGTDMKKKMPGWESSKAADVPGSWQRAASSSGESTPMSLAPFAVGAVASIATGGNPLAGVAAGTAAMIPLFYGATTEQKLREGEAAGLSKEDNIRQANISGAAEVVTEWAQDAISGLVFKGLGTPVKNAVKEGLGGIIKSVVAGKSLGEIAKDFFVTGLVESGGEAANTAIQAWSDKSVGLNPTQDTTTDMVDAAKSALMMTLVFNAFGIPYGVKHASDVRKTLLNPDAPTKAVHRAIAETAHGINEADPELAKLFTEQAVKLHSVGKPILFDDDSYYQKNVAREDASNEAKALTILSLAKEDKAPTPEALSAVGLTDADIPYIMKARKFYEKALGTEKIEIDTMPTEAMKKGALSTIEKRVDSDVLDAIRPVIVREVGAVKDVTQWNKEVQVISAKINPLERELEQIDIQDDAGRPINAERREAIATQLVEVQTQLTEATKRRDAAQAIKDSLSRTVTLDDTEKPETGKINVEGGMTAADILSDVETLRTGGDAKTFAKKYGNAAYAYANTHRTQQDFSMPTFLDHAAKALAPESTNNIQPKEGITQAQHELNVKAYKLIDDKSKPAEIQAFAKSIGVEPIKGYTKDDKPFYFRAKELREKIAAQMEINALHAEPEITTDTKSLDKYDAAENTTADDLEAAAKELKAAEPVPEAHSLTPDEAEEFIAQEEAKAVAAAKPKTGLGWASKEELEQLAKDRKIELPLNADGTVNHKSLITKLRAAQATIDAAAHEAATSPLNKIPEPTPAQKEAGNYKKGHINLQGLDISIENPVGSERKGVSKSGKEWSTTVKHHYGYIKGTVGKDKDHIDTFIGTNLASEKVFVVNQNDPETKKFDEHKVMLGFNSGNDARTAYNSNYEKGWKGAGSIVEMPMSAFKEWLANGNTKIEAIKPKKEVKPNAKVEKAKAQLAEEKAVDETTSKAIAEVTTLSMLEEDATKLRRLAKVFDVPLTVKDTKGELKARTNSQIVRELKDKAKHYLVDKIAKAKDEEVEAEAKAAREALKGNEEKIPGERKNKKKETPPVAPLSPRAVHFTKAINLIDGINDKQRAVLIRIANGENIGTAVPKVPSSTLRALEKRGLIEDSKDRWESATSVWELSGPLSDTPLDDDEIDDIESTYADVVVPDLIEATSRFETEYIMKKGPQNKLPTSENWIRSIDGWLKGSMPSAVKEELFWSDLREWLEGKPSENVTQDEILDYLSEHGLKSQLDVKVTSNKKEGQESDSVIPYESWMFDGGTPDLEVKLLAAYDAGEIPDTEKGNAAKKVAEALREYPDESIATLMGGDTNAQEELRKRALLIIGEAPNVDLTTRDRLMRNFERSSIDLFLDNLAGGTTGTYARFREYFSADAQRSELERIQQQLLELKRIEYAAEFWSGGYDRDEYARDYQDEVNDFEYSGYSVVPMNNAKEMFNIELSIPKHGKDLKVYTTGHWDTKNQVAWARCVVLPTGELFINEIQSDLHNAAHRSGGYAKQGLLAEVTKAYNELSVEMAKALDHLSEIYDGTGPETLKDPAKALDQAIANFKGGVMYSKNVDQVKRDLRRQLAHFYTPNQIDEIMTRLKPLEEKAQTYNAVNSAIEKHPPAFPFKDNYVAVMFKEVVKEATKRGITKIVWPASPAQVARIEQWGTLRNVEGKWVAWSQHVGGSVNQLTQNLTNVVQKSIVPYGGTLGTTQKDLGTRYNTDKDFVWRAEKVVGTDKDGNKVDKGYMLRDQVGDQYPHLFKTEAEALSANMETLPHTYNQFTIGDNLKGMAERGEIPLADRAEAGTTGLTPGEVARGVMKALGTRKIPKWLVIHASNSDLTPVMRRRLGNQPIRGAYYKKQIHLVADRITDPIDAIRGILTHEGGHMLLRADTVWRKQWENIYDLLTDEKSLSEMDKTLLDRIYKEVRLGHAKVWEAQGLSDLERRGMYKEEVMMKYLQLVSQDGLTHQERQAKYSLWTRIWKAVSAFLFRNFGVSMKTLRFEAKDVADMLMADLRKAVEKPLIHKVESIHAYTDRISASSRLETEYVMKKGPQNKFPMAENWIKSVDGWLKGSMPAAIREEVFWSGLREWLVQKQGDNVTQTEVLDFLNENSLKNDLDVKVTSSKVEFKNVEGKSTAPWAYSADDEAGSRQRLIAAATAGSIPHDTNANKAANKAAAVLKTYQDSTFSQWLNEDAESINPAFMALFDTIDKLKYLDLQERDVLRDTLHGNIPIIEDYDSSKYIRQLKETFTGTTLPGISRFIKELDSSAKLSKAIRFGGSMYTNFIHSARAIREYVNATFTGAERAAVPWSQYSIIPAHQAQETFNVELSLPKGIGDSDYRAVHFSKTKNQIAWARCAVLPTGEVFINEVQSDLHNQGKKHGYTSLEAIADFRKYQAEYTSKKAEIWSRPEFAEPISAYESARNNVRTEIKQYIADNHGKQKGKANARIRAYIDSYLNSMKFKKPTTTATEPIRKLQEIIPGIDIEKVRGMMEKMRPSAVSYNTAIHNRYLAKRTLSRPYLTVIPELPFKDNYVPTIFKEVVKEAVKRGINTVVWPMSPIQVAKIENWGAKLHYSDGKWIIGGSTYKVGGSVRQLTEVLTNATKKNIVPYGGTLGSVEIPGMSPALNYGFNMPFISEVKGGYIIEYTSDTAWNRAETNARDAWENDGNSADDFEFDDANIDPDSTIAHIFKTEAEAEKALEDIEETGSADFANTYHQFVIGDKLKDMAERGEIPIADFAETEPHGLSTEKGKSYKITRESSDLDFEEVKLGVVIHSMFVDPNDRRQGIGESMMREVMDAYDRPIYLAVVSPEMNKMAEKLGFELLSGRGQPTEGLNIPEAVNYKTADVWVHRPEIMPDLVDTMGRRPETREEAEYAAHLDKLAAADTIAQRAKNIQTKQLAQLTSQIMNTVQAEQERLNFGKPKKGIKGYTRTIDTQTTNIFTRMFSLPEYYMRRDSSAEKVLEWAQKQGEIKHVTEGMVVGNTFIPLLEGMKKTDPRSYKAGMNYLLDADKTGIGYSVRLVKDRWHVMSPIGKSILDYAKESDAVTAMTAEEQKSLKARGFSEKAMAMVKECRDLTNRGFDVIVDDMRRQIKLARDNGITETTAVHTVGGKDVAVKLSEAIAIVGDLRGTYFPRERPQKNYVLTAQKENALGKKVLIPIDLYLPANELDSALKAGIKGFINQKLPVAAEVKKLMAQGFKESEISINPVKAATETIYDTPGLLTATDSLVSAALENVDRKDMSEAEQKLLEAIYAKINYNIGNIYKAKGSFSSRLKRSESHWEGYETDPLKALTAYAQKIAAGVARRTVARGMLEAFTGRDVSFADFQKSNPGTKYKDYRAEVKRKAISAVNQKNLYDDTRLYMNHVLRPDNAVERAVGYLKGLTVLKYLGFRVSSVAVNATNMAFAAPATIAAHTGMSITKSWGEITSAAAKYAKYRASILEGSNVISKGFKEHLGKLPLAKQDYDIFTYITERGWDEAQFNQDTVRVLQTTANETWNNTMASAMFMFGAVEKANRATTIFAATKAHMKMNKSLTMEEALQKAYHTSNRAHGEYGKGAKPWIVQKVRLLDMPYTFFKFQQNYMLNMLELGIKYNKWGTSVPYMLMSPAILAGAGASLVMPIVAAAIKAMGGGDDPEEAFYTWAEEAFGSDAFARHGFAGLIGINLKGSLEITNPMPDLSKGWLGAMGAPGGVFLDIMSSIDSFMDGQWEKGLEKLLPTAVGSIVKGYREWDEGVTDKVYKPIFYGSDKLKGSPTDFALRVLAFNPGSISGVRQKQWRENQVRLEYQKERAGILEGFNHALVNINNTNNTDFADLYRRITEYNNDVSGADPKYQVPYITSKWLVSSLKRSQKPDKYEKQRPPAGV